MGENSNVELILIILQGVLLLIQESTFPKPICLTMDLVDSH